MLKKLLPLVLLSIFSAAKLPPTGHDQYRQFQAKLETLCRSVDNKVHLGVSVCDATTGQVIFSKNEKHLFNPGSLVKLFTAATILEELGPAFTFDTAIYYDGHKQNDKLQGNLYIKGAGDPSLTSYDIRKMLLAVKQEKIVDVEGGFYIDTSIFDTMEMGPGWMLDDEHALWQHHLSALTIDHNALHITLQKEEQDVQISQNPDGFPLSVESQIAFVSPQREKNVNVLMENDQLTLQGELSLKNNKVDLQVPIAKPIVAAGYLVTKEMDGCGINTLQGFIGEKNLPQTAQIIAQHRSLPLSTLVAEMLKYSDNLYANCFLKRLGQAVSQESGSWKNGAKAVRTLTRDRLHVDIEEATILDGDGQSRYNYLAPKMVTALLQSMHNNFHVGHEFMAALAIGGVDGSLAMRFQDPFMKGNVRAKTGSLQAVSALAGYVKTKTGKILAFTIIQNGAKDQGAAKAFEELFVQELFAYPR